MPVRGHQSDEDWTCIARNAFSTMLCAAATLAVLRRIGLPCAYCASSTL
jgi:hypothetical protein